MNALRTVAALGGLLAADLCGGQAHSGVDIEVSRDYFIVAVADPRQVTEAILDALLVSTPSSPENPSDRWNEALGGPNWIHLRFVPPRLVLAYGGNPLATTPVTEILISFPTRERGRRWPDYVWLKTDSGVLSRAKWSVCQMRKIVVAADFDPASEAPPFDTYCPDGESE